MTEFSVLHEQDLKCGVSGFLPSRFRFMIDKENGGCSFRIGRDGAAWLYGSTRFDPEITAAMNSIKCWSSHGDGITGDGYVLGTDDMPFDPKMVGDHIQLAPAEHYPRVEVLVRFRSRN